MNKKEKMLKYITATIFIAYMFILLRIILFKDAPLYNLFGAGLGMRSLSLIPFYEIFNIITDPTVSSVRVMQNIVGNIAVFVPLGIFISALLKKDFKFTICLGFIVSFFFEVIQYVFALGSSDIDDIILNVLGTFIGACVFLLLKKHFKENIKILTALIILSFIMGCTAIPVVLMTSSDLFKFIKKEVITHNEDILNGINISSPRVNGRFTEYKDFVISIEKAVSSSNEEAEKINMSLNEKTRIIIKDIKENYFLGNVIKEIVTYTEITADNFIYNYSDYIKCPVNIWSEDNLEIDALIIWVWSN